MFADDSMLVETENMVENQNPPFRKLYILCSNMLMQHVVHNFLIRIIH